MEMPGGSSVKSSLLSMVLSCLQQTVSSLRWQMLNIKNVCLQQIPPGYPGCKYIQADAEGRKDFSEIIEIAKQCQPPTEIERGEIIGGFAHNQVLQLADKVVDAVKSGTIRRFVVMAGCDGRMKGRDYYTEFAKAIA